MLPIINSLIAAGGARNPWSNVAFAGRSTWICSFHKSTLWLLSKD
ncbi:hypothetical protein HMPREF0281_02584 [Corynebacterium ammoniagenes DSM 20306]|uniref:Uncharacterized protein n=1 Tax=Corynebacterium ammoniagenes DSM 20306 TaxID=649754 RepID=A0ABN0ACV0_CORAM|nr:hypothetical protein HMPREF0281_02584 [Corynebacterium ammoniagenes DSM 20306]